MVSYNVTSLFTNIPLEETINLTVDFYLKLNLTWRLLEKIYKSFFSSSQVKPIFSLMETCMIKLMGLQWARLWHLFSPIFSWDIMKRSGLGITITEGCIITKGMSMIYLQFLKLKIMLFHFTIIPIGNTGI